MGTKIDQKAYLQKYLGGPSADKKKKKKKVSKGKGFKIIDDDIDLSKLRPLEGDELDILGEGEDAPQIAGIIDERPEEVQKMEQFKTTSKWRVINEDDGFNSKLQIQEIKKDVKEAEKENELIFGKMYSDSEDEQKNNSDPSPPRKQANEQQKQNGHSKKPQNNSDSDFSPPRRKKDETRSKSDSKNYDSDLSPPRKTDPIVKSNSKRTRKDSDSDLSPPRKNEKNKSTREKVRKQSRWGDFEEEKRKAKQLRDSSPPLYQRSSRSPDNKRVKDKRKKSPDSDLSPPRKTKKGNKRNESDSDLSPPRKSKKDSGKKRPKSPDSDLSPPRKRKNSPDRQRLDNKERFGESRQRNSKNSESRYSNRQDSDRRTARDGRRQSRERDSRRHDSLESSRNTRNRRNSDSPPPSNKKMEKTLEGKKAGLQDAVQLRQENDAFRRREEEAFSKMTDEVSGRNAQVVSRKGKRETSEERRKLMEKANKQKELDEKYKKWSKGLKQIEDQQQRVEEFMHEASKPLARHKGDKDLEDRLKDVEREGDPMLKYIREKKRDRGELGPEKPSYKGSFPPNRFNIRPGYRWDGVDRSNGYEKKFFEQQSKRKAQAEEAYKWSTEDL